MNFKAFFILALAFVLLFSFGTNLFANENNEKELESDFIEVIVKPGDTLWKITKKYCGYKEDIRKNIYYIQKYNNLDSSYIYAGQKLKIPIN